GAVSDVLNRMSSSEVFVLPSNFEGMPNALMEAMAVGLPCISTACPCGGPEEIIKDHVNGILVPVGDKKALENALLEVIENKELALTIGNNALNIRESHSVDIISDRWLTFIKSIVKGK
ncbi:MAG: glycosyltransferase family 4 protein, partial [Bacteroidales bacterium]|nr:glycosyltransferase family 4 protein [Bacteroidales bacterium]